LRSTGTVNIGEGRNADGPDAFLTACELLDCILFHRTVECTGLINDL